MMKVQVNQLDDRLILRVEGRVSGAFVPELESCWRAALSIQPKRKISLDVKNVTCIDACGQRLLQMMHDDGVEFVGAGLGIQDILEQVMGQPECKPVGAHGRTSSRASGT